MGDAIYAIDAFPGDDFLWRIEWMGGLGYNTSVPSDPQIQHAWHSFPPAKGIHSAPDLVSFRRKGTVKISGCVATLHLKKLHKAAHHDPVVALAFHEVGNLLKPPSHIIRPRIAVRVLWDNLRSHPKRVPLAQAVHADAASLTERSTIFSK